MKYLLVFLISNTALAADVYINKSTGKELTKVEAAKLLLTQPNTTVVRCSEVELSDKLTIRKKKAPKK